jgi:hypothetical protein
MKLNKILWLGSILLVGAALVLAGCSKKENPYSPNSDYAAGVVGANLVNAGAIAISPGLGAIMADLDPNVSGTQGQIVINFPVDMSPASVTLTNIVLGGGTVTSPTIVFYPEIKRAVISGTFADGYWYTVTFKPGLVSKAGKPIDGNGNGQFDGTPYDDHISYFRTTGAPGAQEPDITHPKVTAWYPTTAGNYSSGAILIGIGFDAGDFDTMTVKSNVTLTDSAGNNVPLRSLGVAGTSMFFAGNAAGDTLRYDTRYILTFVVNNMTDSGVSNNKCTWGNYGYIANVPNLVIPFRTIHSSATEDHTPLHYSSYSGGAGGELVVTFDDSLDYSTINANNIKLYRRSGSTIIGAVNGTIYYQPADVPARRFRITTENCSAGQAMLWIGRNIRDNAGWYLDGNGNNIGREEGDAQQLISSDDVKINF